ncbi:MAG: PBECR4 domain-containing protein [Velocimicrobium sp.]
MSKNNNYLKYAKSRKKTHINIELQQIATEYSKLLNKKFCYYFSGGVRIEFQFKMENFYHLLGFHKLTDVTVVRMVENRRLKKEDFFKHIYDGKITMEITDLKVIGDYETNIVHIQDTSHKSDFGEVKAHRFQFFTEKNVMDMLLSDPVIDFESEDCDTVIEADKIFFKHVTETVRNLNLFIGYDETENQYFTSTFFMEKEKNKFRVKNSGEPQPELKILLRRIIDTQNNSLIDFCVKWENVRNEFINEPFYRGQSRLKAWINSKHISSKEVAEEIKIQQGLLQQYQKDVDELTLQYNIVNLIQQLGEEEKKIDAQLALMEYEIDAENETEIDTYRALEIGTIRTDKYKMEAKTEALTNKLQKHEKHLPDIVELEAQEALLVYQACLPDVSLESERIKELLQQFDVFDDNVVPEEFLKKYMNR